MWLFFPFPLLPLQPGSPALPRRSFSPPQRDTDLARGAVIMDAQSAGSSTSERSEMAQRRLTSTSLTKCSKLQ